ncbi:esterase/lipase family protein [Pseudonocardia sp. CA-107938]|uniref:esterase/lipase family protein n=1 Tax=Pseudonocardia sp. CA-107938 TaxID=3240021 RepID=UPI003D929AF0
MTADGGVLQPVLPRLQTMVHDWWRIVGPVAGVGRRALYAHPVWRDAHDVGRGTGAVVVPGLGGVDASLGVMRRWLTRWGYRPVGSGLAGVFGCTTDLVDRLEAVVERHVEATGAPVVLVGHSRGGQLGRLVAARRPDLLAGLVMFGSPVVAPLQLTGLAARLAEVLPRAAAWGLPGVLDADCLSGPCYEQAAASLAQPLQVPALSVYSKADGVVAWRSSCDPHAECVEISATHTGMGTDPDLYAAVVPRLTAWMSDHVGRRAKA